MTMIRAVAAWYRRIVPEPLRRAIRGRLSRGFYSRAFFDRLDQQQGPSYDVIAATIVDRFHPASVIDVGSGSGALLAALARRGVPALAGLESSGAGLERSRRRGMNVRACDLSQPFHLDGFDLAVCLEVAEHLPPQVADQFAACLASGPDILVFSAATPGQGGENHVNEQPHQYWIERLGRHGFTVDEELTSRVRVEWSELGAAPWYCRNVIFFRR